MICLCRFLAVVLPILTLLTHLLLCTSFALPGNDSTFAFWSLVYNVLAASASILGLVGAIRVRMFRVACFKISDDFVRNRTGLRIRIGIETQADTRMQLMPRLVAVYVFFHTTTLSFVTLALVNIIIPFDFRLLNPILPRRQLDATSLCRDIDVSLGWDDEWLVKCSSSFDFVKLCVAWGGLFLMIAQWWALLTVQNWGQEVRYQQISGNGKTDVEKAGAMGTQHTLVVDKKMGI